MNFPNCFVFRDKLYVLGKNLEVAEGGEYTWNSSSPCTQQVSQLGHTFKFPQAQGHHSTILILKIGDMIFT